jgi:hypothetical protein
MVGSALGGGGHGGGQGSDSEIAKAYLTPHALLMTVAWGLVVPSGVLAAMAKRRAQSDKDRAYWFKIHRSLMIVGVVLTIGGVVAIFVGIADVHGEHFHGAHPMLGSAVVIFAVLQPLGAFLRPKPGSKYRRPWELVHQCTGWMLCVFGMVNIFLGVYNSHLDDGPLHDVRTFMVPIAVVCIIVSLAEGCVVLYKLNIWGKNAMVTDQDGG